MSVELDEGFEIQGVDSEEELAKLLESDDPEILDKVFSGEKVEFKDEADEPDMVPDPKAKAEQDKADETKTETEGTTDQKTDTSKNKSDEKGAASSAEDGLSDTDTQERYVESKNGQHKIPYAVLENARDRATKAEEKYAEAMQKLSASESSSKRIADYLKQQGIDLAAVENGEMLSEEQLKAVEAADPDVGRVIRVLSAQVQFAHSKLADLQPAQNVSPVDLAISRNADLSKWQQDDKDRWELAVNYDNQLRDDPAWKDKSYDARFAEAVRRTKAAFGDADAPTPPTPPLPKTPDLEAAKKAAAEKVAKAAGSQVPRSLTDVGAAPETERSLAERFTEMTPEQIHSKMDSMTPEQIDRLLADIEFI